MTTSSSSTTRMTGLASGMDIDSLVSKLVKVSKTKVDKVYKQRVALEWTQEKYRDISSAIVNFRNNQLAKYKLSSAISAQKAEVTGDTSAVTATATSSAAKGTLNVSVTSVASSAYDVFKMTKSDGTAINSSTKLSELKGFINGGSVTINQKTIGYELTDTLDSLVSKINAAGANVSALHNGTGSISITNKDTGEVTGDFVTFSTAPVDPDDPDSPSSPAIVPTTKNNGTNSILVVNGLTYTQASNSLTVNGVNLVAKQQSALGQTSTVTTSVDTSTILNTIKSFVSDYNALLGTVNTALQEQNYPSYKPLTDDETSAMSDSQVTLWNTKAKSGLLKNDSYLSSLVSTLRTTAISFVGNANSSINIQSIGISTGSYNTNGQLVIDEDKLKAAIDKDPDSIVKLFTGTDSTTTTNANGLKVTGKGIFTQMTSDLMNTLQQLSEKAGTSLTNSSASGSFMESSLLSTQINKLESKESDMNDWLDKLENSYYAKFTAMETSINKLNKQASSISNLFSS